jgi:hypothetical protein
MSPLPRRVEPEWLDTLPHEDPRAVRGRRDLRLVNALMGNERWILREATARPEAAARGIVELGAGEGRLLARLAHLGPATGLDLAPRPAGLTPIVGWRQGDLLEGGDPVKGGILVANLFLHHFSPEQLRRLGRLAERFEAFLAVEPLRSRRALALAALLAPTVGPVTRHDMPASIRAGFRPGELAENLGLSSDWDVTENGSFRGGLRFVATRRT